MEAFSHTIQMLVLDIDGTLLDPQRHITVRTRAAIQKAREAGVIVTLATGRRYGNTKPLAHELGIDIPLILCDGSLIINHPQGHLLHTQPLPAATAQQVVDIFVRYKIQPIVHHINGIIEEIWTGHAEFDHQLLAPYLSKFPEYTYRVPHSELCAGRPDPLRLVAFATEDETRALAAEVAELPCAWNIVRLGNYGCSELAVMHPACSKAAGIRVLAQHLHIPLTNVMAIGDENNDIEMLQEVGLGIAMGQATATVKAAARATTASNAEDGAAQAIERYILQERPLRT